MNVLPFLLRRASRHWQLLLTLSLGVILVTALLASGPLLVDTVVEMSLYLTLQGRDATGGHLRLTAAGSPDQAWFQDLDGQVKSRLEASLAQHLDLIVASATSPGFFSQAEGQPAADLRLNLRFYEGIQSHVEYVAGGWPAEPHPDPHVIRAVVGDGLARTYVLRVGDRLPLRSTQDNAQANAWLEVTGIVRPRNPREAYWFGEYGPLIAQSTADWPIQHSAIVPAEVFFSAIPALYPDQPIALAWHALLRPDSFAVDDIQPFQTRLDTLQEELAELQPAITLQTDVVDILAGFQQQLESIRGPLYILVAEVMLLVLYYVTMIAALWIGQVEREFAVQRSRGASGWQIARIQLTEALIILTVALVSGPWLGAGLVRALAWLGPLADVGLSTWRLRPGQSAWLAAGIGALACLAGLLLPLVPALRRSIVTHSQLVARSSRPPWWQRLYLDVFVLVGGLVLLWRLSLYGEMMAVDWLLLLSPIAFLLGAATVLLRIFPLALRALASIVAHRPGLAGPLALWQASRNPIHVTRLVLLLTLAIALGNLATGLNATLDQSESDRARYLAGNDLRLTSQAAIPLVDLQSAAGVQHLSGAWRGEGIVELETAGSESTSTAYPHLALLAIEPNSFNRVTTIRPDFGQGSEEELLAHLAVEEGQHPSLLLLPGQPSHFGLWLWGRPEDKAELDSYQRWIDGDDDAERVGVVAKLQSAQGELFTVPLPRQQGDHSMERFTLQVNVGQEDVALTIRFWPDTQGWHYFEGPLPVLPPSSYPLSLHSLWFQSQATRLGEPIVKALNLVLDDLTVVDGLSALVPSLTGSWRAERVRQTLKANPLALGLRSVTYFGSVLMITLSLVGFATHFYLSARQRETQYGVMRALGTSPRQLYTSIAIEQAVLILMGLALGTGLGILLNQITLPRLAVSLGDRAPIPPFIPRNDWLIVGGLYCLLAVAFLAMLGVVTATLRRAHLDRVLRIGQE